MILWKRQNYGDSKKWLPRSLTWEFSWGYELGTKFVPREDVIFRAMKLFSMIL